MASLAHQLSPRFRVVEPFQRGSGSGVPLTVAQHVSDLDEVIRVLPGRRPILVGSSWGAMLALAYGARYPRAVSGFVLIGCGTFDEEARSELKRELDRRMSQPLKAQLQRIDVEVENEDERLRRKVQILLPLYSHDAQVGELQDEVIDAAANRETWQDMLRLQKQGAYPASFAAIDSPVLMLHGADDPHPGAMIRQSLERYLPQLEYREWDACGHYPWVERVVRGEFLEVIAKWMERVDAESAAANVS